MREDHDMRIRGGLAVLLGAATLTGCGMGQGGFTPNAGEMPPAIQVDGLMVGTSSRMTLYVFDADAPQVSRCNGPCAQEWPPLLASEKDRDRGDFSVLSRADGRRQWALMGRPLYFWSQENRPGEAAGEQQPGWHAFRVAP